jgi:hypothetical protein
VRRRMMSLCVMMMMTCSQWTEEEERVALSNVSLCACALHISVHTPHAQIDDKSIDIDAAPIINTLASNARFYVVETVRCV